MAFSTPATAVASTVLTAAWLNTYVRDNIAWLATDSPAARAYNNVAFSHTSSANWLAVTFNSERFDNAAVHSTASNTDRFTIPAGGGGKYVVGGALVFAANATGLRFAGSGVNGIATFTANSMGVTNAGVATAISVMSIYSMSAADYFTFCGWQSSGGSLDVIVAANYSPEAFCFWFRV